MAEESVEGRFTAFDYRPGRLGGQRVEMVDVPTSAWGERHRHRLARTASIRGLTPMVGIERRGERARLVQYAPESDDLATRLSSAERPEWSDTSGAVSAAARAVHAGHLDGLAHGSLAPEDVRIHGDDVAVAGMGLGAGAAVVEARRRWTAPEVLAGGAPSARSDVYSLGKVLQEGLAGSTGEPPAELQAVAARAISEDAAERPVSARYLADAIDRAAGPSQRRYGLAALGASEGFRQAVSAARVDGFSAIDADPAAAAVAGAAAGTLGATALDGTASVGTASGGAAPGGAAPAAGGAVAAGANRSPRRWAWAAAALVGVGAVGYAAATGSGGDDADPEVAGVTTVVDDETSATSAPDGEAASDAASTTTSGAGATSEDSAPDDSAPDDSAPDDSAPDDTSSDDTSSDATAPADTAPESDAAPLDASAAAESYELLHAVPGTPLDVYLDGVLLGAGLEAGQALSPLPAEASSLQFFAAVDDPPSTSSERDDAALGSSDLSGAAGLAVIAADAGSEGGGELGVVEHPVDLEPVPAGQGRLDLVGLVGDAAGVSIDGGVPLDAAATPSSLVEAGTHEVTLLDADGSVLSTFEIDVPEGEITTAVLTAAPHGEITAAVRRVVGVGSAPDGVPSGDGGSASDDGVVPVLVVMLAMTAGGLAIRRRGRTVAR